MNNENKNDMITIGDYDDLFQHLCFEAKFKAETDEKVNTEFYFRGHPDSKKYFLEPSIFREKNTDENTLYHEVFRNHFGEFQGMEPIDVLAKMQHYGVATRLLDVTKNPLVAAFFSVSNLEKNRAKVSTPEVLAFEIEKNKIKDYDSDTVKMLSHLVLLKEDEKTQLRVDALNSILIYAVINYINSLHNKKGCFGLKNFYDKNLSSNNELVLEIFYNKKKIKLRNVEKKDIVYEIPSSIEINNYYIIDINELLNGQKLYEFLKEHYFEADVKLKPIFQTNTTNRLFYRISVNYSTFWDVMKPHDLLNGVFVTPILNSDRMKAQQGEFMLFGLSRYWDILKCIKFLEDLGLNYKYKDIMKFIVKDKPLKETSFNDKKNEFENAVFGVKRRYQIVDSQDNVIKNLDVMGINKKTLGCGMDTTYYNLIDRLK